MCDTRIDIALCLSPSQYVCSDCLLNCDHLNIIVGGTAIERPQLLQCYLPGVHHGQHVNFAVGHQQEHLVDPIARVGDARVHVPDDVLVSAQVALERLIN